MSFNVGRTKLGLARARLWHLVDAKGKDLDVLSERVAVALKGQYKPIYHPRSDCGDFVVVINAKDIQVEDPKMGWPGGKRELEFNEMITKHPTLPILKAVYRQLSKESHRRTLMDRLKVFAGPEHPYERNIFRDYTGGTIPKTVSLADLPPLTTPAKQ